MQKIRLFVPIAVLLGAACGGDNRPTATVEAGPDTSIGDDGGMEATADGTSPVDAIADTAHPDTADGSAGDGKVTTDAPTDASVADVSLDVSGDAPPDAAPLGTRLVGYWNFDEVTGTVVHDSSGNGNGGTLMGAATFTSSGFQASDPGSLQLPVSDADSGSGPSVTLGVNGMPSVNGPKTISVWVNYSAAITGANPNQTVVALTNSGMTCGLQLGFRGGNLTASGWYGANYVHTAGAPAAGAWHNIIYTFDGTTNALYVDGAAPVTSTTAPQSCPVVENVVGTYATHTAPYNDYYAGLIDDLRIYSGVLSAAQIATLAAGGDPGVGLADGGADSSADATGSDARGAGDAGGG